VLTVISPVLVGPKWTKSISEIKQGAATSADLVATVMTHLRIQNPEFNTIDWSVMSRKVAEREQPLALSIDPDSFKALTH
jgi:hypothetical protein